MLRQVTHTLLFQLGLVMLAIVALAISSASSSLLIADAIQGKADGVNVAGSLRMLSYRIATALLREDSVAGGAGLAFAEAREVSNLSDQFHRNLLDLQLSEALSPHSEDALHRSYGDLVTRWESEIRPLLSVGADNEPDTSSHFLQRVPGFVEEIDGFVALLARDTETRVAQLRRYQFVLLVATLLMTTLALVITYRKVKRPLKALLKLARETARGDFRSRTPFQGNDELGRLGRAFNLMSRDLDHLYRNLESMVAEKTADLERSRRSLELLYKTARTVGEPAIDTAQFKDLLEEIQLLAQTGPGRICLTDDIARGARMLSSTYPGEQPKSPNCGTRRCDVCFGNEAQKAFEPDGEPSNEMISIPIADQSITHGVLLIEKIKGAELQQWQRSLLEAVAANIAVTLTRARQVSEQRKLALLQERGVIARELHDSLAQALTYLKIQVARLRAAVADTEKNSELLEIIEELRQGIGSAYRELRELLTTFRLRMDEQNLAQALQKTTEEFEQRGAIPIELDYRIKHNVLTPNEEIHLLHIVREALSNVTHHSGASQASIVVQQRDDGRFALSVEDNGRGIAALDDRRHHYGLAIMRERASSLGGELQLGTAQGGGARIEVDFIPAMYG